MLTKVQPNISMAPSEAKAGTPPDAQIEDTRQMLQLEAPIDVLIHELKQPLFCVLILGERLEHQIAEIAPEQFAKHHQLKRDIASLLVSVQQMREILAARTILSNLSEIKDGWGPRMSQHLEALEAMANSHNILFKISNLIKERECGPDPRAVSQILTNLVSNAIEAMEGDATCTHREILVETNNLKSDVSFSVHDSGKGIPSEIVERVFEKGFSTKLAKGGSGYGLWVCRKLAEALGGKLGVGRSDVLSGARFELILPAGNETAEPEAKQNSSYKVA